MNVKKLFFIIAVLVILGISMFCFFLYYTIKTKTASLNNLTPFSEIIDKTVVLNQETYVVKEKNGLFDDKDFSYTLLDNSKIKWELNQATKDSFQDFNGETVYYVPKGAKFHILKAVQYTNGVSGNSSPVVFGHLKSGKSTYKVGFQWGKEDFSKVLDKYDKSWQFPLAPWQNTIDSNFYKLPEGKW